MTTYMVHLCQKLHFPFLATHLSWKAGDVRKLITLTHSREVPAYRSSYRGAPFSRISCDDLSQVYIPFWAKSIPYLERGMGKTKRVKFFYLPRAILQSRAVPANRIHNQTSLLDSGKNAIDIFVVRVLHQEKFVNFP